MKNDLSTVKVGDWIWTIKGGWVKVEKFLYDTHYAIATKNESYTTAGKCNKFDQYPSAFTEPPAEFNAGPKPVRFKKGDKVLVGEDGEEPQRRRYFSHKADGLFYCFIDGGDEWASKGETCPWISCKPWVEGEGG